MRFITVLLMLFTFSAFSQISEKASTDSVFVLNKVKGEWVVSDSVSQHYDFEYSEKENKIITYTEFGQSILYLETKFDKQGIPYTVGYGNSDHKGKHYNVIFDQTEVVLLTRKTKTLHR